MADDKPKQSDNNDIEKCREDILKASGQNMPEQPSKTGNDDQTSPEKSSKPRIPSFEDMIANDSQSSRDEDENVDDCVDVNEIGNILSETGPVDIDNVFNDEQKYDLLDEQDDCVEMLDDTDWQIIDQPSANLDDVPMDGDDDESLEMMVNVDDNGPLVSRQEQDMLMSEFVAEETDQLPDKSVEEDEIAEQIQQGLSAVSGDILDNDNDPSQASQEDIPDFDVYQSILNRQRKENSARRQAPVRKGPKKSGQPTGTVGDIIRQTKADVGAKQPIDKEQPEPSKENQSIEIKTVYNSLIVFMPDIMNQMQHEIIEEIVKRDIDALCV